LRTIHTALASFERALTQQPDSTTRLDAITATIDHVQGAIAALELAAQ